MDGGPYQQVCQRGPGHGAIGFPLPGHIGLRRLVGLHRDRDAVLRDGQHPPRDRLAGRYDLRAVCSAAPAADR